MASLCKLKSYNCLILLYLCNHFEMGDWEMGLLYFAPPLGIRIFPMHQYNSVLVVVSHLQMSQSRAK